MPTRLIDVEIDGVHLVGEPANRRRFALVKNLAGRKPNPMTLSDQLKALFKRLTGQELQDGDQVSVEDLAKAVLEVEGADAALRKQLQLEPTGDPKPAPAIEKEKLAPEVRAHVEALEKQVADQKTASAAVTKRLDAIEKAQADKDRAELRTRAEQLKKAGYEIDPDKASRETVEALEKSAARIEGLLKEAGVFNALGSSEESDAGESIREQVSKEVRARLGREPIDKAEEATVRQQIYKDIPGLLDLVIEEERAAKQEA